MATLQAGGESVLVPLHIDTGAQLTLISREYLEELGFDPPAAPDLADTINWKDFRSPNGSRVALGFRFQDALIELEGASFATTMDVFGSLERIDRSLLGRDFLDRVLLGFDWYGRSLYLSERSTNEFEEVG